MAFSGQDGNLVWQKVKIALAGASPVAQNAFAELKKVLAQQYRNPSLQLLLFSEADADVAGGTPLLAGASTVYGWYVKKENEGTANTVKLFDDVTDDSTTTDQRLSMVLASANQESFQVYGPSVGFPMPTGIVVTQHTTVEGSSDGSNGGNGFVLIGA
jgi:hypothetical protein